MTDFEWKNEFENQLVTYTLELDGEFVIVENVPARVSVETGERFFSPAVVEKIQQIIWQGQVPKKVVKTPVYEFAV